MITSFFPLKNTSECLILITLKVHTIFRCIGFWPEFYCRSFLRIPWVLFGIAKLSKFLTLSQAAACEGMYYQIAPENDQSNRAPGVLPI